MESIEEVTWLVTTDQSEELIDRVIDWVQAIACHGVVHGWQEPRNTHRRRVLPLRVSVTALVAPTE